MKKLLHSVVFAAVAMVVSCVTINIYFPAEEVRDAADRIVDEVWGERAGSQERGSEEAPSPGGALWSPGVGQVYAAQDIDVSTPEIRDLRAAIKERSAAIFSFLDSGHLGIGADGLLKVRTIQGLDMGKRAQLNRLVAAENKDRLRLYQEIASANGFPDKAGEVQEIFAASWREKAASGWYLEKPEGGWGIKH